MNFLWLALPLVAAQPHLEELIARTAEGERAQAKLRSRYVFTELQTVWKVNKAGEIAAGAKPSTEKFEVIFLEGAPFHRLVERNGKPLSAKENRKVEELMQRTAAERRADRRGPIKTHFKMSAGAFFELPEVMDFQYSGEETIAGRPTFLLEAKPKPGFRPANPRQKELANYQHKIWVDEQDFHVVRRQILTIAAGADMEPGTETTMEYFRDADGTVQPQRWLLNYRIKPMGVMTVRGRKEYSFSNYRKFDVESTITFEAEK